MSKVLVVTELVSIVSEKVTETVDVIETDVSPSDGELDDTVGGVVSVLFEPSSLLLLQEMIVRLKRNMEKMMSICLTWFPNWFSRTQCITPIGLFNKEVGRLWRVSDCEELVGVTHKRRWGLFYKNWVLNHVFNKFPL